jgi:hypothetical protein
VPLRSYDGWLLRCDEYPEEITLHVQTFDGADPRWLTP